MRITNNGKFNNYFRREFEDSNDIIKNDEYVGEISKKNINRIINNSNLEGMTLEERNNYKFYVSGKGNSTIFLIDKENNNNINQILNNKNNYKNSTNNKLDNRQIHSNFEKESNKGDTKNYFIFNNNASCDFENVGILKDSSNGQFYKIYQAIPIDINSKNIKIEFEESKKYSINNIKSSYGNRKNFFINSIDIKNEKDKNYVFKKEDNKKEKINIFINNTDNKNDILQSNSKIKSLYFKHNSISPVKQQDIHRNLQTGNKKKKYFKIQNENE